MPDEIKPIEPIVLTTFNTKKQGQQDTKDNIKFNDKPVTPLSDSYDRFEESPVPTSYQIQYDDYINAAEAQKGRTR